MTDLVVSVLGKPVRIRTEFVYPPIPDRTSDWSAVEDGYEPPMPMGWGQTEEAAIADLVEQLEEKEL